jgi:hypothetical protein
VLKKRRKEEIWALLYSMKILLGLPTTENIVANWALYEPVVVIDTQKLLWHQEET